MTIDQEKFVKTFKELDPKEFKPKRVKTILSEISTNEVTSESMESFSNAGAQLFIAVHSYVQVHELMVGTTEEGVDSEKPSDEKIAETEEEKKESPSEPVNEEEVQALAAARTALANLDVKTLVELKCFGKPPQVCIEIGKMVNKLLGLPLKKK